MVKTLKDMTYVKNAVKLSSMNAGTQALVKAIINDSETATITTQVKADDGSYKWSKKKFFNHGDDRDPERGGRENREQGLTISVYYMPASKSEYDDYDVVDKSVGLLSGRRRLVVREDSRGTSFYTTNHPKQEAGLRTNEYGAYTPINCAT